MREAEGSFIRKLAIWVTGFLVLLSGGEAGAQPTAYGLAAKVNGVGISNQTLERNFQEYLREKKVNIAAVRNPDRVKGMRREALDLLIDRELAWQAAQKTEVLATEAEVADAVGAMRGKFKSEKAFVTRLRIEGYTEESYREHVRRLVSARKYMDRVAAKASGISDEEIHAFYTANPAKFRLPEQVRARHILVKVAPGAGEEGKRAAREKIEAILEALRAGGDFAEVARKRSEDSTAARGGDLGIFPRGTMVMPFEDAAFALEAGAVSDPVETPFGLHLIKVEERIPGTIVTEEEAREQIRSFLQGGKTRGAVQAELSRLRSEAKIEILVPL
ncbi:MAG: peptidylprolyl isomerase [Candidatus Deferrimicrobiaceae bacterium]